MRARPWTSVLVAAAWVACIAAVVAAYFLAGRLYKHNQMLGWLFGMSSFWLLAPALVLTWSWLTGRERPGYRHPAKVLLGGLGVSLLGLWLAVFLFSLL